MSKERPLQKDMFSGEVVDTRSDYRKRQDRQAEKGRQMAMFTARETVQYGVNPRPWLKELAAPSMVLEIQDLRTEEEKERDWWREAQKQITPMFGATDAKHSHAHVEVEEQGSAPTNEANAPQTVYSAPKAVIDVYEVLGYRARARYASVCLRRR